MTRTLAVVGTDTGVGKTVVTCGLLHGLREAGLKVAGFKPVETGLEPQSSSGGPAPDWRRLEEASGQEPGTALGVGYRLPAAPLVAARAEGATLDLDALDRHLDGLRAGRDLVVLEGAGGLAVPVADGLLWSDLLVRWSADCFVVGRLGLGTVNHTLLTLAALRSARLEVLGVLLNETAPRGPEASQTPDLIATFGDFVVFETLPLGCVDPAEVAAHLVATGVLRLLTDRVPLR